ncbi:nuclear transport factor 2 family protein [Micromonospora sp. NPDC005087]|uniref:nuclear transport factor 2 family protein n=1 Tax=Micromonospora sp. NPDC005087 TaxID=3364225 RepID=UPI0036CE69EA
MSTDESRIEQVVRRYFDGCNRADVALMCECLTEDAVHYFPPGMYGGAFRGASEIARRWAEAVEKLGSQWTIDRIAVDSERYVAVVEWTHFKVRDDVVLRGLEWHDIDPESGLIAEIRAFYASPQAPSLTRLELANFDYAGRGYPQGATEVTA